MNELLAQTLKVLPDSPGCYLYYDKDGTIIYVGTAKNLKKRIKSYFRKTVDRLKTKVLVSHIEKLEYILTDSEAEALILEAQLIKKHKPKYNILLKDDKKYPYFLITDEEYPRITVVRKKNINPDKGRFYGPYTDARAMYATLDFLKKLFPLKQCKTPKFKSRPCIYYDIGRCMAPCQGKISPQEYQLLIAQAELFLKGKQSELLKKLMEQIQKYSDTEQFEKAARLRDSYFDLQKTLEKQKVVTENTKLNEDVLSFLYENGIFIAVVMQIREGRLIDKKQFAYTNQFDEDITLLIETFIRDYYNMLQQDFPDRILSSHLENFDKKPYEEWLNILSGKNIKISYGKTQKGSELLKLAKKNAQNLMDTTKIEEMNKIIDDFNEVGAYIKEKLNLNNFPYRMECYDISHIQGTNTVASMVVFVNGVSKKSEYRKFKVKSTEGKPDDFMSMKEVLSRRFNRLGDKGWDKPDLIIIDGGKGQLSSVMEIVKDMNITGIDFVSLAKREEEIFLPENSSPVIFPKNSNALFLFQRIRDEAHRFAITYHRKLRTKQSIKK
ncbi:excinuclease ABC subunit UvrC [bacterium]|nr:excinuclease ABC subunit UvrC [bacterium]